MSMIRRLCFIILGITSVARPEEPLNLMRLLSGALIGLFVGFIATSFYRMMLYLFNPKLNREVGKKEIKAIVNRSMVFLLPFTFMSVIATYLLHWHINGAFLSIAFMTISVVANTELEKSTGKAKFKNTLVTTALSGLLAAFWLMLLPYVQYVPSYLAAGAKFVLQYVNGGMPL